MSKNKRSIIVAVVICVLLIAIPLCVVGATTHFGDDITGDTNIDDSLVNDSVGKDNVVEDNIVSDIIGDTNAGYPNASKWQIACDHEGNFVMGYEYTLYLTTDEIFEEECELIEWFVNGKVLGYGGEFSYTPATPDIYTITVKMDGDDVLGPFYMNVGVCDPSEIIFTVNNESGIFYVGKTYYFEADASHTNALLSWAVNGVEYDRDARFSCVFDVAGTYEITLLAYGKECTSMTIRVYDIASMWQIACDAENFIMGYEYMFYLTADMIHDYEPQEISWYVNGEYAGAGSILYYTPTENDVYKVEATMDGVYVLNSPYTMNVGICQPEDITFVVDNESGIFYVGETYYFEADDSHTTALLSWKVNGVEYDRGARFNFTFETPGTYEITLLAFGRKCTSMTIVVLPVPTTENLNRCGDDLYWDFDEETGVLTITGTGEMYGFKCNQSPWFSEYFDEIKEVRIGAEVESIGSHAFEGCDVLREVIIETDENGNNALTSVGEHAFAGCVNLEGIYGFNNVETIGSYAFMDCIQLESINAEVEIVLPTTLTELGFATFYNCDGIYEIVIPVGVTEIPAYAFYACDNLEEVHMHDNMDKINEGAFVRCDFLSEVYIYDTDVEIVGKAFSNYGEWDIVFYGYAGSTTEEYANTYGEDFYDFDFASNLKFDKKSVSLGNKFEINYYINSAILEGFTGTYVHFEKPIYNEAGEVINIEIENVSDYTVRTVGGVTYYVFTYSDIYSYELGTTISAEINTTSEKYGFVYSSNNDKYSIRMYAERMLEKTTDAELRTLLVDMLNYGAAAQLYFDYNEIDLANAGLTDEQKAFASAEMNEINSYKDVVSNPDATVAIKGCTLNLINNVEVAFYVDLKEYHQEDVHAVITYVDRNGKTQTAIVDGTSFAPNSGLYRFAFSDLAAADMRTVFTMVVYDSHTNEAISDSYTSSIESYAANAMSKMTDPEILTLLESMIKFGDSAEAYFA